MDCILLSWDSPGKNSAVSCHFLLQGIFLIQGIKPTFLALWVLYHWARYERGAVPQISEALVELPAKKSLALEKVKKFLKREREREKWRQKKRAVSFQANWIAGIWRTTDGVCSHEIERYLLFERKVISNLDSWLKSRDITLPTKVHLVKAMVFPVVMYGCESWTIKKAEHWRTDAFELWCWRRLFRVPWTAVRLNQSTS